MSAASILCAALAATLAAGAIATRAVSIELCTKTSCIRVGGDVLMDETQIKRAIGAAVREALQFAKVEKQPHKVLAVATEYAEQIIMPVVNVAIEQALEDGFRQGRAVGDAAEQVLTNSSIGLRAAAEAAQ